ncbi:hypothetical protein BsWGS_17684 [Bradybaena similaris]
MRRLICRYIHQSKKLSRQGGVKEDDLLEIKQDISSLRFELREDRKREVVRTTGHMDSLRHDLRSTIAHLTSCPPGTPINGLSPSRGLYQTTFCGRTLFDGRSLQPPLQFDRRSPLNTSQESADTPKNILLTSLDLECLKADIVTGIKDELRLVLQQTVQAEWKHTAHMMSSSQRHLSSVAHSDSQPGSLPSYSSDLYNTHLYTQL